MPTKSPPNLLIRLPLIPQRDIASSFVGITGSKPEASVLQLWPHVALQVMRKSAICRARVGSGRGGLYYPQDAPKHAFGSSGVGIEVISELTSGGVVHAELHNIASMTAAVFFIDDLVCLHMCARVGGQWHGSGSEEGNRPWTAIG